MGYCPAYSGYSPAYSGYSPTYSGYSPTVVNSGYSPTVVNSGYGLPTEPWPPVPTLLSLGLPSIPYEVYKLRPVSTLRSL